MGRMMKTSRPMWCDEGEDVETAAIIDIDGESAEYRQTDGADPQGMRASGGGADPMGMKNNPDRKK